MQYAQDIFQSYSCSQLKVTNSSGYFAYEVVRQRCDVRLIKWEVSI